jgi:hypothetical protein
MEPRDEVNEVARFVARQEQAAHPLSYPGEERHEVREQTESRGLESQRLTFDARVQALSERIQALRQVQAREYGREMS